MYVCEVDCDLFGNGTVELYFARDGREIRTD